MRDYRDAKTMAHTLREALAPRLIVTHSESLELVAKLFGFVDWNVLSSKLHSGNPVSEPIGGGIKIDIKILDQYVGFYRFNDDTVATISRDGSQLSIQLTGQGRIRIYAKSDTDFLAENLDAQITFIAKSGSERAEALILHQKGVASASTRIDEEEAIRLLAEFKEKVKKQKASAGTETALRRMVDSLYGGAPNYEEMTPALAQVTRDLLPVVQKEMRDAGPLRSLRFLGVGRLGADVYVAEHEHYNLHWRIRLDSDGKVSLSFFSVGL